MIYTLTDFIYLDISVLLYFLIFCFADFVDNCKSPVEENNKVSSQYSSVILFHCGDFILQTFYDLHRCVSDHLFHFDTFHQLGNKFFLCFSVLLRMKI